MDFKKILPIGDKILVEVPELTTKVEEKTLSGIILPATDSEHVALERSRCIEGKVLVVGTGEAVTKAIKEGEFILFFRLAGDRHTLNGKPVVIINLADVVAKLEFTVVDDVI